MNRRDICFSLPLDDKGNTIIITNLYNIAHGGDYDDVDVFAYINKKEYSFYRDGFAFGVCAELYEEDRPRQAEQQDLYVKNVGDKCKVILPHDVNNSFFDPTLFVGDKYGFFYYKFNGETHIRFARMKFNYKGKDTTCKIKLLYKTVLTPDIIQIWENVRVTEYLPRLEIERYLIQHADLRERYKHFEDVDISKCEKV